MSYSNYSDVLEGFFSKANPEFSSLKTKFKGILQTEESLNDIVQLVGKDSLSEDQKCVMEIARLIREDFLKQNAFSDYDYFCPLYKTIGMMKSMIVFYDQAIKAISESGAESKLTWSVIETKLK